MTPALPSFSLKVVATDTLSKPRRRRPRETGTLMKRYAQFS